MKSRERKYLLSQKTERLFGRLNLDYSDPEDVEFYKQLKKVDKKRIFHEVSWPGIPYNEENINFKVIPVGSEDSPYNEQLGLK